MYSVCVRERERESLCVVYVFEQINFVYLWFECVCKREGEGESLCGVCVCGVPGCVWSGSVCYCVLLCRSKERRGYPFKLSVVGKDGLSCATCPWHK